jgi:murein DD-endopeptidase MepM/ murein hydrolase activator NlpD
MEQIKDWAHIVLVPSYIVDSGWQIYLPNDEIVNLIAQKQSDGNWKVFIVNDQTKDELKEIVPSALVDISTPQSTNNAYLFPWTSGDRWKKTNGWHPTNAIDFVRANGNNSRNVLAAEAGTLTQVCNDGYQAKVRVNHGSVTTGYLHLSAGSIPSDLINHEVVRGTIIGSLYTGSDMIPDENNPYCSGISGLKFWTPCGCGTGEHLHFETSNTGITIDGYNINTVANSAYGTLYLSHNTPSGATCSAPSLISPGDGETVHDRTVTFRWNAPSCSL